MTEYDIPELTRAAIADAIEWIPIHVIAHLDDKLRLPTIEEKNAAIQQVRDLLATVQITASSAAISFPVVTICGSMKFYPRMLEVAAKLTATGRIVLMPHDASLTGIANKTAIDHGRMLDEMHRAKIRASQSVYVVNTGGYIGESTRSEIAYATELGMPIEYDFTTPDGYTDYAATPQGLAAAAFAAESEA